MVEANKQAQAAKPAAAETKKAESKEGIFGGIVTQNNPLEEDIAFDGRKKK